MITRTNGNFGLPKPNWKNRTLFHGNNLDFLRAMNTESVDLVAMDPPFNKGKDFHATPDSLSAGAKFEDRWTWIDDVQSEWVDQIRSTHIELHNYILAVRDHDEATAAFLCFLAVRLIALHRILKSTGSIYLHCDPTASHYIKQIMDIIFGKDNFRNEIIWHYGLGAFRAKENFPKKHDNIFFYTKSKDYVFNKLRGEVTPAMDAKYCHEDENGRYMMAKGKKYYLKGGKPFDTVWDIPTLSATSKERCGYPTQKPVALYERIIEASSNPGDIVLDPFCGCATTLMAAESLNRQWVGIDLWPKAIDLVRNRLFNLSNSLLFENGEEKVPEVITTTTPPERTDDGLNHAPVLKSINRKKKSSMSLKKIKDTLLGDYGYGCQGCGRVFSDDAYLHVDHNAPKSGGGSDAIDNRLLLCGPCNGRKSDILTLPGLRAKLKSQGLRHIDKKGLIDFRDREPEI